MGFVDWVRRHPVLVLVACFGLIAASVDVAYRRLEYHTQRNDLLSADKECQKRWQQYLDAFGDDDDMVVVVEGKDRAQMAAALDAIAEKVKARPERFDRAFHKADLRGLQDRALLYLPPQELDAIRDRLDRMDPLLGRFAPVAWQMLSLQTLLSTATGILKDQAAGKNLPATDRDLISQLPAVARSAADTLRNPDAYRNPWGIAGGMSIYFYPSGRLWAVVAALWCVYLFIRGPHRGRIALGVFVAAASDKTVWSLSPRLRIVSIMPGIESRAPERTATSSGIPAVAPNLVPMMRSMLATPASIWPWSSLG